METQTENEDLVRKKYRTKDVINITLGELYGIGFCLTYTHDHKLVAEYGERVMVLQERLIELIQKL